MSTYDLVFTQVTCHDNSRVHYPHYAYPCQLPASGWWESESKNMRFDVPQIDLKSYLRFQNAVYY